MNDETENDVVEYEGDDAVEEAASGLGFNDLFGTDADAEEDGRWFFIGPYMEIKLRRFTCKISRKVRTKLEKPYRRGGFRGKELPEELAEAITIKQMAQAIIVDWRGKNWKTDPDKKGNRRKIEYSQEMAQQLLDASMDFRNQVATLAFDMDGYRVEDKEETAKN